MNQRNLFLLKNIRELLQCVDFREEEIKQEANSEHITSSLVKLKGQPGSAAGGWKAFFSPRRARRKKRRENLDSSELAP